MSSTKRNLSTVTAALAMAVLILAGTLFLANRVSQSRLYRQSQIFRAIAAQEQFDWRTMLSSGETRNVTLLFVGAVTNAYVSFEMIPINEGLTFVAVMQSLTPGIHIEGFEYRRRNLIIEGVAATPEDYNHFTQNLRNSGHFQDVSGHSYLTVDDTVRFEIECVSAQQFTGGVFPQAGTVSYL